MVECDITNKLNCELVGFDGIRVQVFGERIVKKLMSTHQKMSSLYPMQDPVGSET